MARRDKIEIMVGILEVCRDERAKKTKIVYNANLNFHMANKYLDMLIGKELLAKDGNEYRTTDKGCSFVEAASNVLI
jgi:predicted transcriptional regulator